MSLRRKNCWCLALTAIFLLLLFSVNVSAVRINEVMPKTPASIYGDNCEWIELYGQNENLIDYTINTTNEKTNFSVYVENYIIITKNKTAFMQNWNVSENKIIEWRGISLLDSGENVFLFDNSSTLISNLSYPSFSSYENKTYSLLSNLNWVICNEPTPGQENLCQEQNSNYNQTQNNTTNQTNQSQQNTSIFLKLDYEKEINNGEEFDVEVRAFNLNNSYDVKVYVDFDNGTTISETYDENEKAWKSSKYYIEKVFSRTGNKTVNLRIRIKEENNFTGNGQINARLRETGTDKVVAEFLDNIKILEKQASNTGTNETTSQNANETESVNLMETRNVIKLNSPKDIKSQNAEIVWKSKTQYIKEYGVYAFVILCVFLVILLVIKKL